MPSVKSENCFGLTYGKTSYLSNSGQIPTGMDLPAYVKYNTTTNSEYIDHNTRSHLVETTAQIVGVQKGDTTFKKVSCFIDA